MTTTTTDARRGRCGMREWPSQRQLRLNLGRQVCGAAFAGEAQCEPPDFLRLLVMAHFAVDECQHECVQRRALTLDCYRFLEIRQGLPVSPPCLPVAGLGGSWPSDGPGCGSMRLRNALTPPKNGQGLRARSLSCCASPHAAG